MSMKNVKTPKALSRRAVLKGAAGLAGAAAGSGAITGFPAIWAQEEKVLRYLELRSPSRHREMLERARRG